MKYIGSILLLIALSARIAYAQTAVDFTATDCQGTQINLYDELNAGKVVVMVWIMPCGSCIGPAKTAFNVAKSFKDSHPGRVSYFLVDDYANSTCNSISNWASTNNIQPASVFSSSVIKMSDYGSDGMPKVVVLAGSEHKVLFNKNNSDAGNAGEIQAAISQGLNFTTAIQPVAETGTPLNIYPNPACDELFVHIAATGIEDLKIMNSSGQEVARLEIDHLSFGNDPRLDISCLPSGFYILKAGTFAQRFIISK